MTTPPPPPPASTPAAGPAAKNWMGITALILGIVGIVGACCFGAGFLFGAGAIVLGILGKNAVKAGDANNGGMAQVGFILGIAGVALSLLWFIFAVVLNVWSVGYGGSYMP